MAFQVKAQYTEEEFKRISDVPLLRDYAKDKTFCKSGVFQIQHIVPPARFQNYSVLNYKLDVRVNIIPGNAEAFEYLNELSDLLNKGVMKTNWVGCQISNRQLGQVNLGEDEDKQVEWEKVKLGWKLKVWPLIPLFKQT